MNTTTRDSLALGIPIGLGLGGVAIAFLVAGFFIAAVSLIAAGFVAAAVTVPLAVRNVRRRKAEAAA